MAQNLIKVKSKCPALNQVSAILYECQCALVCMYTCILIFIFVLEDTKDTEVSSIPQSSQLTWKQGRQLLRQ